ncbi:tyrosine-type recombinase/integrase [Solimonas sp. SE-A11]|uniref:tyrosine-type recombinase/integrase n=1 Tax=Solimonas sp. SE-A11 TaxID=3054954 RepID=UPI00259C6FD6|nr:tyrosine-type recombinase/integrase [Solimonas sp. SE-A11]MDM4770917.1 tyrosine-type recombinase/integrase [Solimonas sp. SE-A11]
MNSPTPVGAGLDALAELAHTAPEHLVDRLQALATDVQLAYAPNTLRSWRADWRIWTAFCQEQGFPTLPADLPALRAFLDARIAQKRSRATLDHNLATLALVHRLAGLPWALDTLEGRLMWRGKRRSLPKRQAQASGLTLDLIERLQAPLAPGRPQDARDAALMGVAFESMCRISELVALQVDQLEVKPNGSGRLLIARSKTDPEGEGAVQYLSPATVLRLQHWLRLAGITEGPLFRSTPRSNQADRYARPLSARDIPRILLRRAAAAGVVLPRISGHSTRVGAAQDLLAADVGLPEVMRQGRWKTARMPVRYAEDLEAERGGMARLLATRQAQQAGLQSATMSDELDQGS